jgi:hypothetical protein
LDDKHFCQQYIRLGSRNLVVSNMGKCKKVKLFLDRLPGLRRLRLPGFSENWHMKVVRLSSVDTGHLHPPGNIPGYHFY